MTPPHAAPRALALAALATLAFASAGPCAAASGAYLLGSGVGPQTDSTLGLPAAKHSDPTLFPQGYYDGDPLPTSTIYLSFDDGPSEFTAEILDILKSEGVPATFFINSFARDGKGDPWRNALLPQASVLQRMLREGHALGNHTFSHRNLATQGPESLDRELDLLEQHVREALGDDAPVLHLVRPPFGSPWVGAKWTDQQRRQVATSLAQRGLLMLWGFDWDSTDSAEWVKGEWYTVSSPLYKPTTPAYAAKVKRILDHLLGLAQDGRSGIVLLHDMHPTSRDVLRPLIRELKARGYTFQTLEDYARWRWGPHVFDRFHLNDPKARPKPPTLPGIARAALAERPFPPDQSTAPRLRRERHPDQASAPRISSAAHRPERPEWPRTPDEIWGEAVTQLPAWFPRCIYLPGSDSLMAGLQAPSDSLSN